MSFRFLSRTTMARSCQLSHSFQVGRGFVCLYGENRPRLDLEYPVYWAHELPWFHGCPHRQFSFFSFWISPRPRFEPFLQGKLLECNEINHLCTAECISHSKAKPHTSHFLFRFLCKTALVALKVLSPLLLLRNWRIYREKKMA